MNTYYILDIMHDMVKTKINTAFLEDRVQEGVQTYS